MAIVVIGDSELVVNWLNGVAVVRCPKLANKVAKTINGIHASWRSGFLSPRTASSDWYRNVYRELHHEADSLANKAMDEL